MTERKERCPCGVDHGPEIGHFQTRQGPWALEVELYNELLAVYGQRPAWDAPPLDVHQELVYAAHWLKDNPDRQKTRRGMRRFIGNWLRKAHRQHVDKWAGPVWAAKRQAGY